MNQEEKTLFKKYHKIQSAYLRDTRGQFIAGQYARDWIPYLANNEWEWTEKVDGTNVRIGVVDGQYQVGGRTDAAQLPGPLAESIRGFALDEKLPSHFADSDVILYGEGYGPKIQKGGARYRSDVSFVLFDVKVGNWWLKRTDVDDIAAALGIDSVPVIGRGTLAEAEAFCVNQKSTWGDFDAEGLVIRPLVPLLARDGSRILLKVKGKDYRRGFVPGPDSSQG